jgi:D-alanyl-D-alanine carboxypeptidase
VTRNTPFAVGSITKTFVAALILRLAKEGRLGLDDPVVRWLPTAPVDPAVTVRQLLDHTSGVHDFFSNKLIDPALAGNKRRVWTPALDLRYVKDPYFVPGGGWHYSNTNYVLLGLIAQKASGGTSVPAQLRARFIDPLRLLSVSYQGAEPPRAAIAHAYTFGTAGVAARPIDQGDGSAIVPFTSVTTAAGAAGALAASSWDLARWARALYRGRVLAPDSLGAMLDVSRSVPFRPVYPYGLGVQQLTIGGWPGDRPAAGSSGRPSRATSLIWASRSRSRRTSGGLIPDRRRQGACRGRSAPSATPAGPDAVTKPVCLPRTDTDAVAPQRRPSVCRRLLPRRALHLTPDRSGYP